MATGLARTLSIVEVFPERAIRYSADDQRPIRRSVQKYYRRIESRIGYRWILGNNRHCGLYKKGAIWPFPIRKAQKAMERKLFLRLKLPPGAKVLDVGAGSGCVAINMADMGLKVSAIELVPEHVKEMNRNIRRCDHVDDIHVQEGNFHNLAAFGNAGFDGIYAMESFVHAENPIQAIREFRRVLKPGGVLVLHHADFTKTNDQIREVFRLTHCPGIRMRGDIEGKLKDLGFLDIDVEDLSSEVVPLWRLLAFIGYVPYQFVKILGLQDRFPNTYSAVQIYRNADKFRYVSIRAVRPST
ncbi:cyclopropane-fatty-acyl-phospholipid synthase [Microthyrium microscopicum]|uniref:Cyclopropane-fatty-acyl-phospholipid synthase n=1 Tax=Microthyrium microscopicum TaxID=703497 RepID=A0A6A6UJF8_9PEZI|nr:cyclopropane-fatty-acyl-phospholipid synthase [Microthyrium microscopicum]